MNTEKLFKTPLSEAQIKNSDLNHLECNSGKVTLESFPRRIVFELTNKCNFQCIMCGRETVDFETTDLPVSAIKDCGVFFPYTEEVTLHGWGEGTLHPKLGEILEYLNTFPLLRKYFVTNGSTLPRITDNIFKHHVDLVAVSLDGATPESNNSIRKGGDLHRELNSVKKLIDEKKKRNLNYPYVNFVMTLMRRNIHELPDMVDLAHELGVPEVKAVYLTIFNEALRSESLVDKHELVKKHFAEARERAAKSSVNLKLPEIQGECYAGARPHKPCAFPWRDLYIGSDGFVRPCQSSAEHIVNIREYKSMTDLWNSSKMQELRRRVNDEEQMSRNCRSCYHSTCANWNLNSSFIQLGNEFAPEWDVKGAHIAKKELMTKKEQAKEA
ncbi:MAG: radical SAM protein [Deltaproteobacteria bacterium]|nr:radical SAM protein [Deltaproteobacteria bacterium]